jgi:hypothetical protein
MKQTRHLFMWAVIAFLLTVGANGQDTLPAYKMVSPVKVFHQMGRNA